MVRRLYKKGINPLIATMLLIAFAVSVGVTVMNIGGSYYSKSGNGQLECSKLSINAFELEDERQCLNYEFDSIINFYPADEIINAPLCYKEVLSGDGKVCLASNVLFDQTWAPTQTLIK